MIAISRDTRRERSPTQPRNQYPPDAPLGKGLTGGDQPLRCPRELHPPPTNRRPPHRRAPAHRLRHAAPTPIGTAATRPSPPTDGAQLRARRHPDQPWTRARAPRRTRRPSRCGCPGRPPTRPRRPSCSARSTPARSRGCSTRPRSRSPTRRRPTAGPGRGAAPPDGHTVDVAEGGRKLTLSLTQPGRAGAGGIWVVTGETRRLTHPSAAQRRTRRRCGGRAAATRHNARHFFG